MTQEDTNIFEVFVDNQSLFLDAFRNFRSEFERSHDIYRPWLINSIKTGLSNSEFSKALQNIGIDWLTIHYKTRHIEDEFSDLGAWIQAGIPMARPLKKHEIELQVYQKSESPFISSFVRGQTKSGGKPVVISFASDDNVKVPTPDIVSVEQSLSNYIKRIVSGQEAQQDFDEPEVRKCKQISETTVNLITRKFSELSGSSLSDAKALGLFRNVCRVTFLALKNDYVVLPRIVILIPVFVDENVIGGISFIGNKEIDNLTKSGLYYLANSSLTSIRLREEPFREAKIQQNVELNRARASFVQRISHSLQSPLEAIETHFNETIDKFKTISDLIKDLSRASSDIMLAFSKENADDLLMVKKVEVNLKEFVDLLVFIYGARYKEKGKELVASQNISKEWSLHMDKTAIWEVMSNLITNALRYARSRVLVSVERPATGGLYILSVVDDGAIGISPKVQDRLFRPGVSDQENREGKIHGFGLYLSMRVVEKHGGKMYWDKQFKKGTRFVVELPQ